MAVNTQWQMAIAISKVCQIQMRTATGRQKGTILQTAKNLRAAGFEPEQVADFGKWWYKLDWRGIKGSPPKPFQIRTMWGQFEAWVGASGKDELPVYT